MTDQEVLAEFRNAGALLNGHFVLRSGLHSREFFQCALVLRRPAVAERLCRALAQLIDASVVDLVISPALGGILVGHEVARALDRPHIFAEKEDGGLVLRRGFSIEPGTRCLVAEDVITQGGRVRETMRIVTDRGGIVAGVATLVHRGADEPDFGCPFHRLLRLPVETFAPDAIPEDLRAIPAVKPGSK
jgi:orotate phosphoribosyltransferase